MSTEDYYFGVTEHKKDYTHDLVYRYNDVVYRYNDDEQKLYYTTLNNYEGVNDINIHFKDGEVATYKNAYDLQDFLNQVNHYHDLEKDFNIVVKKLLEAKPELQEWVKKNFSQYLKEDN